MGTALQARPGEWAIVPDAAQVGFRGRASRFSPVVQARFGQVSGCVRLAERDSQVAVDVDLASMTTGNAAWDELLQALDPFDVRRHPVGAYRSDAVRVDDSRAEVEGTLELCGRRSRVRLSGTHRVLDDARARLTATGSVDRRAFGLRLDVPGCRFLLPAQLELQVDVVVARRV